MNNEVDCSFDATVESCRRVTVEVNPRRTRFAIQMMSRSLPDSLESYLRLLQAVDRKGFAVHLDPFNGINCAARYYRNSGFITECFRQLGPWIVSCHGKDLEMLPESNIHLSEVVPGRGRVDYRTYLRELSKLSRDLPLMLEHLKTPAEYEEGRQYIQGVARELGLSLA
jgi:sugar phosphate isomerase/epimerase